MVDPRIFGAVILLIWLQTIQGMTTTREPFEKESLSFIYDPTTHMMGMTVTGNGAKECYVINLNSQESVLVHSPSGIQGLEQKLVNLMTSDSKTLTSLAQLNATSPRLAHKCHHAATLYLLSPQ